SQLLTFTGHSIVGNTMTLHHQHARGGTSRRRSRELRETSLELREGKIDKAIARDESALYAAADAKLPADPKVLLRWQPLMAHPLPMSYARFREEALLRRLCALAPERRAHAAVAHGSAWCIEELYRLGCSMDARDTTGRTALHVAAGLNDAAAVSALLNAGADPFAVTDAGTTVFRSAVAGGGNDCAAAWLLRARGIEMDPPHLRPEPLCFLDAEVRRPRRAMDDRADYLGRGYAYAGQY
ncbi:unnamed protein product, partial [Phaeothamnion confervicola]